MLHTDLIPFHWMRLELVGNMPYADTDPSPLTSLYSSNTVVLAQVDVPNNQTNCQF